eukprot:scaffold167677_cov30-Tisochrysis_lutea.AAC.4
MPYALRLRLGDPPPPPFLLMGARHFCRQLPRAIELSPNGSKLGRNGMQRFLGAGELSVRRLELLVLLAKQRTAPLRLQFRGVQVNGQRRQSPARHHGVLASVSGLLTCLICNVACLYQLGRSERQLRPNRRELRPNRRQLRGRDGCSCRLLALHPCQGRRLELELVGGHAGRLGRRGRLLRRRALFVKRAGELAAASAHLARRVCVAPRPARSLPPAQGPHALHPTRAPSRALHIGGASGARPHSPTLRRTCGPLRPQPWPWRPPLRAPARPRRRRPEARPLRTWFPKGLERLQPVSAGRVEGRPRRCLPRPPFHHWNPHHHQQPHR